MWITCSPRAVGVAAAAGPRPEGMKMAVIPTSTLHAIPVTMSLLFFMTLSFYDRPLGEGVLCSSHLGLHGTETEPVVRLGRIPRDRCLLGHGTWSGQGKHEGLCRVVGDVPSQVVMLLVDMAIEDR